MYAAAYVPVGRGASNKQPSLGDNAPARSPSSSHAWTTYTPKPWAMSKAWWTTSSQRSIRITERLVMDVTWGYRLAARKGVMAQPSKTGYVKKVCGCVKWKDCAHPWYVNYREGKENGAGGKVRERGRLQWKLAPLVGREPGDFADAKMEARRAIAAWKDGRDARELLPGTRQPGYPPRPHTTRGQRSARAQHVRREGHDRFEAQRDAFPGRSLRYPEGRRLTFSPRFDYDSPAQLALPTGSDPIGARSVECRSRMYSRKR